MTEQKLEVRRNRGRTGRAESYGPASLPSGLGRLTFWFRQIYVLCRPAQLQRKPVNAGFVLKTNL